MLLWKGICRYVVRHPRHAVLFGAVSISKEYNDSARSLTVEWLKRHRYSRVLGSLVKARNPFRHPSSSRNEIQRFVNSASTMEALSDAVSEIDPQGKGLPVLLKHYLKLGGQVAFFNIDAGFSNALDCLFLVDLRSAEPATIRRFMGEDGYEAFSRFHRLFLRPRPDGVLK